MDDFVQHSIGFVRLHAGWTGPIVFLVAFGESFAFVSLFVPGTAIMIAAGALVPEGAVPIAPLLAGGVAGAVLGDGISYWLGLRFGHLIPGIWPFKTRPELLRTGHAFFERHGGKSIFLGRFFGPVRSVIPLVAGMMEMPARSFWRANVASALLWAPLVTLSGVAATSVWNVIEDEESWWPFAILGLLFAIAALAWIARTYRPHMR